MYLFCNLSKCNLLIYFISAAVILLASLALIVQVSLPYNKTGRASVLYNFIIVFLRVFCGLNTLFKISRRLGEKEEELDKILNENNLLYNSRCNYDLRQDNYSSIRWQFCRKRNATKAWKKYIPETNTSVYMYTQRSLFYLTNILVHYTDSFAWHHEAQWSSLFAFSDSSCSRISVQCNAPNDGNLPFIYWKISVTSAQILLNDHYIITSHTSTCYNP